MSAGFGGDSDQAPNSLAPISAPTFTGVTRYEILNSTLMKAYEEIIEFIAAGTTPGAVVSYRPSEATKQRVQDLIERDKSSGLSEEEKSELDHYMELEHIMRLAKARAHRYVTRQ